MNGYLDNNLKYFLFWKAKAESSEFLWRDSFPQDFPNIKHVPRIWISNSRQDLGEIWSQSHLLSPGKQRVSLGGILMEFT